MSDFYIGELRLFPYNKIPRGWHLCDGSSMQIQGNAALFALIGTTYGGDGRTTFNLPDMRGRAVMGYSAAQAANYPWGKPAGAETVTLTAPQALPLHTHQVAVVNNSVANSNAATGAFMAQINPTANGNMSSASYYATSGGASSLVPLSAQTVGSSGGGQPHNNMQPFLALNYCIALLGNFPPRT